jgi:uncharacterized protein YecT (DUF1311 family)
VGTERQAAPRGGWPCERAGAVLALALLAPACSKASPSPASDAAPSAEKVDPSAQKADSSPLGDGARDYQGTLGAKTAIAVHLVRTGRAVRGSYVYTAVGRPIALEGTVDENGAIALTETADSKVTGTFRLHRQGDGLDGEWSDPSGKKTFPVQLSAGPPFDAGRADASSDANVADVDCFRALDGIGAAPDATRARACFDAQAKAHDCGGGSADLQTAQLAMMRIDGVGGPVDVPGARALLAGCFDDATRSGILEHAAAKERDPKTPPLDFCKAIGGTTITSNECLARESKNADAKRELEVKTAVASLDATGKNLFAASEKAFGDYVTSRGAFVYEVYSQGTIRNAMSLGEEQRLKAAHAKDLAGFSSFVAKETSGKDVEAAQREAAAALAKAAAGTTTPAEKQALTKTQQAWTAYRDAEVAFYEHAFGPKQGADRVRAAVLFRLESRRAKECAPPSAAAE